MRWGVLLVALAAAGEVRWRASGPLLTPGPAGAFDETAVKDPSVVRHDERWHVFYTARGRGRYSLGYVSAAHWEELGKAPRHHLAQLRGAKEDYAAAPQVFYFRPQKRWYLIYQTKDANYLPVYSTTVKLSDPRAWSRPRPLLGKSDAAKWIDFWVICDERHAWLFYTRDHRELVARRTPLAQFPTGWGAEETVFAPLHEAAHVYRVAGAAPRYRMIYETQENDRRAYGLAEAEQLPGPWKVAEARFATGPQLDYAQGAARWTEEVSHGELIRADAAERMEIAEGRMQFLIQGLREGTHTGPYESLPWRLGLISADPGKLASRPLFRDPVYDGAADPVLVWDMATSKWLMFYTNRRASLEKVDGVDWVHGTRIGIAESGDGGATWTYNGTANILYGTEGYTHWAPDIVQHEGRYHMFLSIVPGIFRDWNAGREIVHLTSRNLRHWELGSKLDLGSDRVIDASVVRLKNGRWRMWYKDERAKGGSLHYADSEDLYNWKARGTAIAGVSGEGPKIFEWRGRYWMVADVWDGLAVFRSEDAERWERQPANLLKEPGREATDRSKGQHADVVVSGGRAYLIYFVHQGGKDAEGKPPGWQRRTVIQAAELEYRDGWLECDRSKPARIALEPGR